MEVCQKDREQEINNILATANLVSVKRNYCMLRSSHKQSFQKSGKIRARPFSPQHDFILSGPFSAALDIRANKKYFRGRAAKIAARVIARGV